MSTEPEFVSASETKPFLLDQEPETTSQFVVAEQSAPLQAEQNTISPRSPAALTVSQQAILARMVALEESIAESGPDTPRGRALAQVLQDYQRLWKVKANVENQSEELKKHYFKIFKERNVYFKKLRMIEYYGEEHQWSSPDDGGLLEQIHQHLNQQKS